MLTMWEYIRINKKISKNQVALNNNVSRQTIYLFEKGKLRTPKLMSYYLRLNGRDIDLKLANVIDGKYDEYYKELKNE